MSIKYRNKQMSEAEILTLLEYLNNICQPFVTKGPFLVV